MSSRKLGFSPNSCFVCGHIRIQQLLDEQKIRRSQRPFNHSWKLYKDFSLGWVGNTCGYRGNSKCSLILQFDGNFVKIQQNNNFVPIYSAAKQIHVALIKSLSITPCWSVYGTSSSDTGRLVTWLRSWRCATCNSNITHPTVHCGCSFLFYYSLQYLKLIICQISMTFADAFLVNEHCSRYPQWQIHRISGGFFTTKATPGSSRKCSVCISSNLIQFCYGGKKLNSTKEYSRQLESCVGLADSATKNAKHCIER